MRFYGAQDQRVNATEPIAKAALEKAGLVHELVTEPDANHAFFNDTGDRYNATAADDAWRRVQDWFSKYVGMSPARATVFVRNFQRVAVQTRSLAAIHDLFSYRLVSRC